MGEMQYWANSEEESGLYFQWGDTQGYTPEQIGNSGEGLKYFYWNDYKFSMDDSASNLSKYNDSDGKTVLDPEDDAAHVIMGGNWRMPTFDECKELFMNTDVYLVQTDDKEIHGTESQNDDSGYFIQWDENPTLSTFKGIKFYKRGDKQTYLFVPASGYIFLSSVKNVGTSGCLWSASLLGQGVSQAWYHSFDDEWARIYTSGRYYGHPVRGVLAQ